MKPRQLSSAPQGPVASSFQASNWAAQTQPGGYNPTDFGYSTTAPTPAASTGPTQTAAAADADDNSRLPTEAELVLPPLPDPVVPEHIGSSSVKEIYTLLDSMRACVDGNESQLRDALMQDPNMAVAMLRVLHEAQCLRDSSGAPIAPPEALPPSLPRGYKSWVLRASDVKGAVTD
eukprot:PhM_4_TR8529/c0_g1_i1/m.87457